MSSVSPECMTDIKNAVVTLHDAAAAAEVFIGLCTEDTRPLTLQDWHDYKDGIELAIEATNLLGDREAEVNKVCAPQKKAK